MRALPGEVGNGARGTLTDDGAPGGADYRGVESVGAKAGPCPGTMLVTGRSKTVRRPACRAAASVARGSSGEPIVPHYGAGALGREPGYVAGCPAAAGPTTSMSLRSTITRVDDERRLDALAARLATSHAPLATHQLLRDGTGRWLPYRAHEQHAPLHRSEGIPMQPVSRSPSWAAYRWPR